MKNFLIILSAVLVLFCENSFEMSIDEDYDGFFPTVETTTEDPVYMDFMVTNKPVVVTTVKEQTPYVATTTEFTPEIAKTKSIFDIFDEMSTTVKSVKAIVGSRGPRVSSTTEFDFLDFDFNFDFDFTPQVEERLPAFSCSDKGPIFCMSPDQVWIQTEIPEKLDFALPIVATTNTELITSEV